MLRRLDALRLVPRHAVRSGASGSRRSLRRGASVEFADFREYAPGDDLRSVDWNAYGRLGKLFLKLFIDEEDLGLHLLVDTSASMAFGMLVPKSLYAKRMAAALGYVALSRGDRVSLAALTQTGSATPMTGLRGQAGIGPLFSHLLQMQTGGDLQIGRALIRYAARVHNPGMAVVISDFFDESWEQGVKALRAQRFEVVLVHLLASEEVNPLVSGDVSLRDSETGEICPVSISPALLDAYQQRLRSFYADLESAAKRHDMTYVRLETDISIESAVRRLSEGGGILR